MQSFRWAIRFGICIVLGLPAFAGDVYNFDLANQYAAGAINSAATFTANQSNQNVSITAAGYAQQGGAGAYQSASLYENTSAAAGAAAGLGLSDAANSNKISQNGHEFLQLDISNLLTAARSGGLNTVGISISGVDSANDNYLLFGGSTKGSFVGSTLLAYGSNNGTVNLNLSSLIAKNFDYISILSPDGGVLVDGVRASFNGTAAQFLAAPAIGANTPEPSTTILFALSALLVGGFLVRRKLAVRTADR